LFIWLEALTAKQALLMSYLYESLTRQNLDVVITTRQYDYIIGIFKNRNIPFIIVGKYGGETLKEKLQQSLQRQIRLLDIAIKHKPDIHISFVSPDSTRVAFGLGIPTILLTDTPHSTYVNKLTIPLANCVIAPLCTKESWEKYGYKGDVFRFFKGVFEVAWTAKFKPNKSELEQLDLEEYNYIILRTEEKKASYYSSYASRYSEPTFTVKLLDYIIEKLKMNIVFFPRYKEQRDYVSSRYGEKVIIPKESLFLQHLEYYAYSVITGGSTLAVESALLGTPSITLFPRKLETVSWLKSLNFPIFQITDPFNSFQDITRLLRKAEEYRKNTSKTLKNLEDPIPLIVKEVLNLSNIHG